MEIFQMLAADSCGGLGDIIGVIKGVFDIIKIIVPIILLIMGAIDLAKAVLASDDKEIKAATSKLTKRAIAAVAVFFSVTIVEVVMTLVGDQKWKTCWDGSGKSGAGSGTVSSNT